MTLSNINLEELLAAAGGGDPGKSKFLLENEKNKRIKRKKGTRRGTVISQDVLHKYVREEGRREGGREGKREGGRGEGGRGSYFSMCAIGRYDGIPQYSPSHGTSLASLSFGTYSNNGFISLSLIIVISSTSICMKLLS